MRKLAITLTIIFLSILGLLFTAVGLAQRAVVNQPVDPATARTADLPTDYPLVKIRLDEGMFTLFAALNAAGYDREFPGLAYHPARQIVRERLAGKQFSGLARLRAELKTIHPYNFVVWSLHFGPPPAFERVEPGWSDRGIPGFAFYNLDRQMRSFYEELDIAALWQEVRPLYEQEATRYQETAGQAVQEMVAYTRLENLPFKQVVVIPNLLYANWSGNGPTVGDTAYVVIGPTEDQSGDGLIQHETLHSIVGPLVEANINVIDEQHGQALYKDLNQRVPSGYGSWESLLEEQVVRALDCRLDYASCVQYGLRNDEAQGFLLVRPLTEKLAEFEQGSSDLAEFMPQWLQFINEVSLATGQP